MQPDEADLDIWAELQKHGEVDESTSLSDYIYADQELATAGTRTLEEIADSCTLNISNSNVDSDDDAVQLQEPELPPVSRQVAYAGFDQLRRYVEENAMDPKYLQMCHQLEDFLEQERAKKSIQTTLTQFMPKPTQPSITQFFK